MLIRVIVMSAIGTELFCIAVPLFDDYEDL